MKKYGLGFISFLLLVGIDQFTKHLAVLFLKGTPGIEWIPGVFRLEYLENRGAAFGIFQGQQIPLLAVTLLILLGIAWVYHRIPSQHSYLPLQVVLILLGSGAVGNMIDRLCRNFVVDFFSFYLIHFPVFNVADCYVVIGVILAAILILFVYEEDDLAFIRSDHKK